MPVLPLGSGMTEGAVPLTVRPDAARTSVWPARDRPFADGRPVAILVAGLFLALAAVYWFAVARTPGLWSSYAGVDYTLYMEATHRWLSSGAFYEAHQLAGPYTIAAGAILYPPIGLLLFAPFTVLPTLAWWAAPLGIVAWSLWRLRPAPWSWPLIAACAAYPDTGLRVLTGNPAMWVMAAAALGCIYRWPFVGVLLKPSLFPFALLGMRRRSWWLALAVGLVLAVPFGGMWSDWIAAIVNGHTPDGLFYSLHEAPMIALPIVALLGSASSPIAVRVMSSGAARAVPADRVAP